MLKHDRVGYFYAIKRISFSLQGKDKPKAVKGNTFRGNDWSTHNRTLFMQMNWLIKKKIRITVIRKENF